MQSIALQSVLQGYYGGLSPRMRTSALPTAVSVGRDEQNDHNTAKLKEYPSDFNKAIAGKCWAWMRGRHQNGGANLADIDVLSLAQDLPFADNPEAQMGPDYVPDLWRS